MTGDTPTAPVTVDYGTTFTNWIVNSPFEPAGLTTQYLCVAGTVVSNEFSQIGPTNVVAMLTNNATLTWTWTTNYYLTLVTAGASGGVDRASGFYEINSNVVVTATASNHYHLASWSGDTNGCTISDTNLTTAALTGPQWITANFAIDTYTLRYTADANGWISGTATQTVAYGATGTVVTANGNPGWYLVKW